MWCWFSPTIFAIFTCSAFSAPRLLSMSKLRPEYLANLRKSVKTALEQSPFSGTWKHRFLEKNSIHPDFDVVSVNKAITLSCKTGELEHARQLFDTMPNRTVVSWNTMITGYSKWDKLPEALDLISLMHRSGVKLDETTFSTSLKRLWAGQSLVTGSRFMGWL
ncbi:Pentatricopeptide repeat-containing protein, chloroplastic [Sesamum alatum]|uniref:Pentatricopeptide repeat-containing protein, chloroplastic n=1 Tax=Sesamum alatum TaxID=300844 RepID=A0AAE1YU98_9LAMI|nr:Pentatricopeptide repeat-containing protein, chloroplastic [Sesamum alatum]